MNEHQECCDDEDIEFLSDLQGVRAVFSGGGTGGHLYPLLAVAEELQRQCDGNLLFIGTSRGLESEIVPQRGLRFKAVAARGLVGGLVGKLRALLALGTGIVQSWRLLRDFRPQIVVGSGGYVCASALIAAKILQIPTALMEQNAHAGKTVRWLAKFADVVCTCWPEVEGGLPASKIVLTGNPVRREVIEAQRDECRERLRIPADRPCVFITGGSQGAVSFNEAVVRALPTWCDQPWTVVHLTGPTHLDDVRLRALPLVEGKHLDYRPLGYLQDMACAYGACDLVVCRAGATTLAEVTVRGLATVAVPYPYAAENHQMVNAMALVDAGAAELIEDKQVVEKLATVVPRLLAQPETMRRMAQANAFFGRPDAVRRVLQALAQCVQSRR